MKFLVMVLCLSFATASFAEQILETDCAGINNNREKIIKTVNVKSIKKNFTTKQ